MDGDSLAAVALPGKKELASSQRDWEVLVVDVSESPLEGPKPNRDATTVAKKPHTHKLQVVIDQPSQEMICTAYTHGRKHDFQVFPHSQAPPLPHPCIAPRTGLARTSSTTSP